MKKVLIHACCADCLIKMIESLKPQNSKRINFDIYFYNPNIHPRSEFLARLQAIKQVTKERDLKIIIANWSPKEYFSAVKTNSNPGRCNICWTLRLSKTASYASEHGYNAFTTTLLSSHYQNTAQILKICKNLARKFSLEIIAPTDLKKDLCTGGFYKQNFCGCCYSLVERYREKFSEDL
ncbi:hypothetical protein GF357_01695 [Candidatus Dojkabacteria bacterium]|nr:hypothetical protein [Candidatus Dojkabacteria bacterium]